MKYFIILLIIYSFYNCNEKTVKKKNKESGLFVKLNFPDTVYVNELNDGYIDPLAPRRV
jgi:hypothetical protein